MVVVRLEDGTHFDAGSVEIHAEWVAAYKIDTEDWLYVPARRVQEISASDDEKDDSMGVKIID